MDYKCECGREGSYDENYVAMCPCGKKLEPLKADKDAGAKLACSDGLSCLDGVEVTCIDKYRRNANLNEDEDGARIVINLKFPEHLRLYYELRKKKAR